jgi:pimeloyl-ACP methyl ester carboxylesterase
MADGRVLAYREEGSGPVLVCVPGGPGLASAYLGDLGGLSADRTLIVIEPRGVGASDAAAEPSAYALSDYVADLKEFVEAMGFQEVDLLGHSHGSLVAIVYAAAEHDLLGRLVLVATGARFSDEHVAAMEEAMRARADEPWFQNASAAMADEEAGRFATDAELGRLVARELPFYFARYGEREAAAAGDTAGLGVWTGVGMGVRSARVMVAAAPGTGVGSLPSRVEQLMVARAAAARVSAAVKRASTRRV